MQHNNQVGGDYNISEVAKIEIAAIGDGNCLLNAFILASKDIIATGYLDDNANDNQATRKAKEAAREQWKLLFTSIFSNNTWDWELIKQYFIDVDTFKKKQELQKKFAPWLRQLICGPESRYIAIFKSNCISPLLSEFERYVNRKKSNTPADTTGTEIFEGCKNVEEFFSILYKEITASSFSYEKALEQSKQKLNAAWEGRFYSAPNLGELYLSYLANPGVPLGELELGLLAEIFGMSPSIYHGDSQTPNFIQQSYGQLSMQIDSKTICQLVDRDIIFKSSGKYHFRRLINPELLRRRLNAVDQRIIECQSIEEINQKIPGLGKETLDILKERNLLNTANNRIISDLNQVEVFARLGKVACLEEVVQCYNNFYLHLPIIGMVQRPGSSPGVSHWNVRLHKETHPDMGLNAENNSNETAEEENILAHPGYINALRLAGNYTVKNLPPAFSWTDIPMLAVITGKNGIGKTAVLDAVLEGFERILRNQTQFQVELTLREGENNDCPDIFEFSSVSGGLRQSTSKHSAERYDKEINEQFTDIMQYDKAKRYGMRRQPLKFPRFEDRYDRIIKQCEQLCAQEALNSGGDYVNTFYKQLKRILEADIGLHIATYGSLEKFCKYLLENGAIDSLNNFLKEKGFKYQISSESIQRNATDNSIVFKRLSFLITGQKQTIDHTWLAPGEILELLFLLWSYESNIINTDDIGAVFLMDEPDAHLHPSLARELIETIKNTLVNKYHIQVIMTTHNPTTVSMVPKDNLYIMSDNNSDKKVTLQRATSKKQAIQLLASDFVCVNEPFRLVFVEAEADKVFYAFIRKRLIDLRIINPNQQILFMAHGKNQTDSSCDLVRSIVENCVENTNNADKSLREFIFGIVDCDNKEKPASANIFVLRRYAIENYIYDPVHIFYWAKQHIAENSEFKSIHSQIMDNIVAKRLALPDKIEDLLSMDGDKNVVILQIIVDVVTDHLRQFFQEKYTTNDSEFENVTDLLNNERFKHLVQSGGELNFQREKIEFLGGFCLHYPLFILELKGHWLEFLYGKLFALSKQNGFSKNFILNVTCRNGFLMPLDIIKLFKKLQEEIHYYNDSSTKEEGGLANSQSKQDDLRLTEYKNQMANKDKKLQNQAEALKQKEQKLTTLNRQVAELVEHNCKSVFLRPNSMFGRYYEHEDIEEIKKNEETMPGLIKDNLKEQRKKLLDSKKAPIVASKARK